MALQKQTLGPGFYELHNNYGFYIDRTPSEVFQELDQQIKLLQQDFSGSPNIFFIRLNFKKL